jgi:outer membrane immunogenic protein
VTFLQHAEFFWWTVTLPYWFLLPSRVEVGGHRGHAMKIQIAVGCCAAVLMTGVSFAADLPATLQQLYRPAPFIPQQAVQWTGLYFGINAGYGWAQHAQNIRFVGNPNFGGLTNPASFFGFIVPGPTELSGANLMNSIDLNGGIAGGQIGFNWQAGMIVFGAELDGQWSGQQSTFTVNCGPRCTASENIKIRSLLTGRARVGLAFDWIMPYLTGGVALVNGINNLTMTVGGVTADFAPLSDTALGWTAGGGIEVALWSNWSAKLEYLYVSANGGNTTAPIPNALGLGTATTPMDYRDNIVRVGLNYRFGPRGGPGVLEASASPRESYAVSYGFLPNVESEQTKSSRRPHATAKIVDRDAQQAAQAAPIASGFKTADVIPRNFADIGDVDDTGALGTEPNHLKAPSKKHQGKEEDESLRMRRIMSICTGC